MDEKIRQNNENNEVAKSGLALASEAVEAVKESNELTRRAIELVKDVMPPKIVTPKPERQQVLLALVQRVTEIQNQFRVASLELNSMMFMAMAELQIRPGEWKFHTDQCVFSEVPKPEEAPK